MKIIVYTAVTGSYDSVAAPPLDWGREAEFVAFLEKMQPTQGWSVRPLELISDDPCRNAKRPKILPHEYFPDAEYSIWIDGSISIKAVVLVGKFVLECLQKNDLALFRHRRRSCIYEEAEACINSNKDNA